MALSNKSGRVHFSSTIKNELYEKLQQISKETDIPISRLLDRAIEFYLKQLESSK